MFTSKNKLVMMELKIIPSQEILLNYPLNSLFTKFDFWHNRPLVRFNTSTVAMHTELNPIVLHLWT